MKKIICLACALALLICAGIPAASAYGHSHGGSSCINSAWCDRNQTGSNQQQCSSNGTCINNCQFADENQDGVCDNCNGVCRNCENGADEDGDGVCDNCKKCSHYKDADNDGVCDRHADCGNNQKSTSTKATRKYSRHHSNGGGHHGKNHH